MISVRLSMQQTFAQIGVRTQAAQVQIQSPAGDLQISTSPAQLQIQSPPGELSIDSSQAWAALGKGPNLQWSSAIYSQGYIVLQGIQKTVEEGNRMADITKPGNAFAEIAADNFPPSDPVDYITAEPSSSNVHIQYTVNKPNISYTPGKANIRYTPQKPDIQVNPGNIDVYIRQKNSLQISLSDYHFLA